MSQTSRPVSQLLVLAAIVCISLTGFAADTKEVEPIVPQTLLKLVHAPEIQKELGLDSDEPIREILQKIDRQWWPSRNLPEAKQIETIRQLEKQLLESLKEILSPEKIRRLREIEMQSQGTRAFIRPTVAKALGLDTQQIQTIKSAAIATDTIARMLAEKRGTDAVLEKDLQATREKELNTLSNLLTNPQRQELVKLIGKPFNTQELKRIYPLAPALIDSGEWAGVGKKTLETERGKVVLIHFYAFQCHNCVANFNHYNRWHEKLSSKGVSVIGIQTPETSAERDPALVKKAALDKDFGFPVLIDLKNENWNAWGNTMWPTIYVVDKNGYLRSWWQGELNWQGATGDKTIEKMIDELLVED